jgi:hypothetical protein
MDATSAPARPSFLKRLRRFVLLAVLAFVVLFGLYTWVAWSFSYSEGDRAGYVQKFSKKGWICKTWEGELAMANIPGSMPQIFQFTVWDEQVAADMNASMGERVTVHYKQHVGLPSTCFGDTQYFVQRVRRVEN